MDAEHTTFHLVSGFHDDRTALIYDSFVELLNFELHLNLLMFGLVNLIAVLFADSASLFLSLLLVGSECLSDGSVLLGVLLNELMRFGLKLLPEIGGALELLFEASFRLLERSLGLI